MTREKVAACRMCDGTKEIGFLCPVCFEGLVTGTPCPKRAEHRQPCPFCSPTMTDLMVSPEEIDKVIP